MNYEITFADLLEAAKERKPYELNNEEDVNLLKTKIYFSRLVNNIYSLLEVEITNKNIEWRGPSSVIQYVIVECWCDFQFPYNGTDWNEEAFQKLEQIKVNMVNKILSDLEEVYLSEDAWF